jgi:CBS domain-containing protein
MNSAIERLLTLRVSDVMSREVVILSANQSMSSAAAVLARRGISGAPVTDEFGRCNGILSATDFVLRDSALAERRKGALGKRPLSERGEITELLTAADEDRVADHMSKMVHTVEADRPLVAAARIMCAEHVHRLPVVDKQNRLIGLITSLDVAAATVNAIAE